jgi:hypothetical protein
MGWELDCRVRAGAGAAVYDKIASAVAAARVRFDLEARNQTPTRLWEQQHDDDQRMGQNREYPS